MKAVDLDYNIYVMKRRPTRESKETGKERSWRKPRGSQAPRGQESACDPKSPLEGSDWEAKCPESMENELEKVEPQEVLKNIITQLETGESVARSRDSYMVQDYKSSSTQEQFDYFYGAACSANLERQIPQLEGMLQRTAVTAELRAKMIDWMLEVFNYFRPDSDDYTFFRAVTLMDLFFKNNQRPPAARLANADVHLVGVTAIFVASKYEDNRNIALNSLIANAGKGKFTPELIIKMEWELLLAIGFNSSLPTHLDCLDAILNHNFADKHCEMFQNIRYFAIYFLKICLYYVETASYRMNRIALACIILSVHSNFDSMIVDIINQGGHGMEQIASRKNLLVLL
jgi:hypothetical protein